MALTDTAVMQAKAAEKPTKLFDGGGLYLLVNGRGKYWRLKYRFGGKEKGLSFGIYPKVTLEEAREQRDQARALLAAGVDPSQARKHDRAIRRDRAARPGAAVLFSLNSDGPLSICLGARHMNLDPSETARLRVFLDATRNVIPRSSLHGTD